MASIQIEKEYDDMLNQLKGRLQKSKKHILENAIRYIHINKIDPENIKNGDPTAELKLLRKELIGFIKTQEKNKLDPMLHNLSIMVRNFDEKYKNPLNTELLRSELSPINENFKTMIKAYKALSENTQKQAPILSRQLTEIKEQLDSITTKLNTKF